MAFFDNHMELAETRINDRKRVVEYLHFKRDGGRFNEAERDT